MLPVVPLPDGGHAKIAVIGIDKLCDVTLGMVTALSCPAEANLFELELTSLRELVLDAAAEMGRRPYVLPVPARLLTWVLKLATWSGIRLPVNRDNLDGLLANQLASHVSTMKADHVEKH